MKLPKQLVVKEHDRDEHRRYGVFELPQNMYKNIIVFPVFTKE